MRGFRLLISFVVSLAVLFQVVVPASAAEGSLAPYVASDYLSGLAQAKLRDHRVLITSELSEESTTWVNADGTLTTDSYGSPVRVKDPNGLYGWRDLDFTLTFAVDGSVVPRSGLLPLTISGGGTASQVGSTGLVSATNAKGAYRLFGNLFRLEATFRSPMEKSDGKKYANLGIGLRSGQKSTSKGAFEIELHIPVWSRTDVYNGEEEGHF